MRTSESSLWLRRSVLGFALACALLTFSPGARGTVFDWPSTPGWTAGAPTIGGTQTVDYSSTGQDISVSLFNSGATWNGGYPQVAAGGGGFVNGGTTNNGFIMQPGSQVSNATYIQMTINFNNPAGVTNVSFQLWDIDGQVDAVGNYVDMISHLQATAVGGGTVYPDIVDNTHTSNPGIAYNHITGSGATLAITGDPNLPAANNTDQGTVSISFNQPITQISFWYSNANTTSGTLSTQTIGISPITYTVVPEPSTVLAVVAMGAAVLAREVRRRRRFVG